ncbi:19374_t:CDS:2 [Cetraspora pellucida]|uniref:19374_t:CDS:1 n=1 Tax=Cetraspora pellucida TaxID=1433469 RepID=A0A9N9DPN3_9GLOM|nr:19374_t:CDS:2 [Cetraspora pellucida]
MSKQSAQVIRYKGGETVTGVPTRNDISKCDNGLTAILQQSLSEKKPIHFMPNDVEDAFELVKIIFGAEKIDKLKFEMKVVHAYPICGYHIQEKVYIRIITWNHYDRRRILREVPCEKKLPLSERVILSGYNYISDMDSPHYSYSFRVSVDNYQSLEENKPDDQQENISVEWFVSRMEAKYSCEVLENQQLIKKAMDRKKKSKEKKLKIAKDLLQSRLLGDSLNHDSPSLDEDEIAKIKDEE